MKYLYPVLVLFFILSSLFSTMAQTDTLSTYPYYQNFENDTIGWHLPGEPDTIGAFSRWEVRYDSLTTPDYYPSGNMALFCNSGLAQSTYYAYSPIFNIAGLLHIDCRFLAFSRQGSNIAPFLLPMEVRVDNDTVWSAIDLSQYQFLPWTDISLNFDSLVGYNFLQFRFTSLPLNACYIDNFYFGEGSTLANDIKLSRFISPTKNLDTLAVPIQVEIVNTGTQALSQFGINMRFHGDSIVSDTVNTALPPGDTLVYAFSDSILQSDYAYDDLEVWLAEGTDVNTFDNHLVYYNRPTNMVIDTLPYNKSSLDNAYPEWTYSGPYAFNFLLGYYYKMYESPRFNFSNIELPAIDFRIEVTQPFDNVGMLLLFYSTDGGNSLHFVDTVIEVKSFNGTTASDYFEYTFPELAGNDNVKFVFHKINQSFTALSGVTPTNLSVTDYSKNIAPISIKNTNCYSYALSTFFVEVANLGLYDAQNFDLVFHVDTFTLSTTIPLLTAGDTLVQSISIGQPLEVPDIKNITVYTTWIDDLVQNDNTLTEKYHLTEMVQQYPYRWNVDSLHTEWYPNQPLIFNYPDYATNSGLPGFYDMDLGNFPEWYFESPCFNFSQLSQPLLNMQLSIETNNSTLDPHNAFTFQYSLDDGQSWQTMGDLGTGYNWYDQDFEHFANTDTSGAWVESFEMRTAAHALDFLAGEFMVRFRFLAGYSGPVESISLSLNNFEIFEDSIVYGCTDTLATNFNYWADIDDGTCDYWGCTDTVALNFEPGTTINDGSCYYFGDSCQLHYDYGYINDSAITATLADQGNFEAWYSFTLDQDYVDITASLCGSLFDSYLEIYTDCNSYPIYRNDNNTDCEIFLNGKIDIEHLPAGTYYARVGHNWNIGLLDYTLEITGSDAILGCTDPTAYNYNPMANYDDSSCYDLQTLELTSGWSLISTHIVPFENYLDSIFDGITQEVLICKNEAGLVYWPIFSLDLIGPIQIGKAYMIKMNSYQSIDVIGDRVAPEDHPLVLPQGWSMLGYLRTDPALLDVVFTPVASQTILVKDHFGMVYWPIYNFNLIGNMIPGRGYQVAMNTAQTLTYPSNDSLLKSSTIMPELNHLSLNTGNNMTLGLKLTNVTSNTYIQVYSKEGILVGEVEAREGLTVVPLWGDDQYTPILDGMIETDPFEIRVVNKPDGIYSLSEPSEGQILIPEWEKGDGTYHKNGIAISKTIDLANELQGFKVYPVRPNPFSAETWFCFYLPEGQMATIDIYDISGKHVDQMVFSELDKGMQYMKYQANKLTPGSYYFKISNEQYSGVGKMQVIK